MRKERLVFDFVKLPVAQKVEYGRNVTARMKGNSKFGNSDGIIEELEAKTTELETRSVVAQGGGKEATALMHQTENEWIELMRKLARNVDLVADGDPVVILSAGFTLAKQPAPAVRPEFSVELGEKSGSIVLHRQAMEGAKSYIWQYCTGDTPAADHEWVTTQVTTKATVELTGLATLTKHWFRTAAVTSSGTTAYNSPIMQVVI